jgi:hypothetical protein
MTINRRGHDMNAPTIIIKYTCQESLERLPDLYIKSMRDSIALIADNKERLHEMKLELMNMRAIVEEYQARIWARDNGFRLDKEIL